MTTNANDAEEFGGGVITMTKQRKPPLLIDIANNVRPIIEAAEADGLKINNGNVIDLLADNIPGVSLFDLRCALVVAGYSPRFSRAIWDQLND